MDGQLPQREIENLPQWDRAVDQALRGGTGFNRWTVQSLDLRDRADQLEQIDPSGILFLGCQLPPQMQEELRERGALVFPTLPELPFNPYRSALYRPAELYDAVLHGSTYAECFDARVYAWYRALPEPPEIPDTLAMALHDHAMSDALDEVCAPIAPAKTVGIMGGHAVARGDDAYIGAARLASALTVAGRTVITGGGPGAMEAANLGAYLAGDYARLSQAIGDLADSASFTEDVTLWAHRALDIIGTTRPRGFSIGVPTWFYGHEPPNVFASVIAKYFSNALREDTILRRCRGGIIYLPGAAGTVQEIFQATTANFYAQSPDQISPLILVGRQFWTEQVPAWQLLQALGQGRLMRDSVHLVDEVDDAAALVIG